MSHDRYTDRPVVCACCDVAVSSFRHTVEQCRTWSMLWQWAQDTCRQAGQPIPGTVRRQEWMAFGVGIYGAHDDGWTVRHDVAAMIWGAVLYAIRVVTANRLRDGTPAAPLAAVKLAQTRVRRIATGELWWTRNRDEWLRYGGDDTRRAPTTLSAWAAKWSGLFRLRCTNRRRLLPE
jgi:hypothetical protein